jgi:acyl carrier protein
MIDDVFPRLQRIAAKVLGIPKASVKPESKVSDIVQDSLDVVEFLMNVEEEFGIAIDDHKVDEAVTIADWAKMIEEAKR